MSCPSASFCVAVGQDDSGAIALTYNGSSWSAPTTFDSVRELRSVSCPSASFCVAVGGDGRRAGAAVTYNGSLWSGPRPSTPSIPTDPPILSYRPFRARRRRSAPRWDQGSGNGQTFNGSSWSASTKVSPGGDIVTVTCPSSSFCLAGNEYGGIAAYNGSSWAQSIGDSGRSALTLLVRDAVVLCNAFSRARLTYDGRLVTPVTMAAVISGGGLAAVSCARRRSASRWTGTDELSATPALRGALPLSSTVVGRLPDLDVVPVGVVLCRSRRRRQPRCRSTEARGARP